MDEILVSNGYDGTEPSVPATPHDESSAAFAEIGAASKAGREALHAILMALAIRLCSPSQLQTTRRAISDAAAREHSAPLAWDWERKAHDAIVEVVVQTPEIVSRPFADVASMATALIGAATGGLQIAALIGHTEPDKARKTLDERITDALSLVLGPDPRPVAVSITR